ncbi:hypothetical protein V2I01_35610 [Micromonospora sp. BRA006-A]|nr:hypothetical protein [Micromonospora sp. BRA006-A]
MLLFGHDALVFLLRYLVEGLTEAELMALTREHVIANCSVTAWHADDAGRLVPEVFNDVAHLHRQGRSPPGRTRSMPSRSDVITPALLRDWALPVPTGGRRRAAPCWWSAAPGSPPARCCWPGWPRCGPAPVCSS